MREGEVNALMSALMLRGNLKEFRGGLSRRIPAFQRAAPLVASFRTISEDVSVFTDRAELNPIATRELELAAGVRGRVPWGFTLGITPTFRWWRGGASSERRSAQEAMAGIAFRVPTFGPIQAIGEFTVGAIGSGAGFLTRRTGTPSGQIISGGRVGGEIHTGVLDVRMERGFNSAGGDIWFIRLGQRF